MAQSIAVELTKDAAQVETDTRAMGVAIALFFMVGFLTCLNDIIIPHLKSIFELPYGEAMLVQFSFFSSYFIFSYPGGKLVDVVGYKRAMVGGLIIMGIGALGFVPAATVASFGVFLAALVVLAAGMTTVQVAANPYVTIVGPPATASSRLNLHKPSIPSGRLSHPFWAPCSSSRGPSRLLLSGCTICRKQRNNSIVQPKRQRSACRTSAWRLFSFAWPSGLALSS